MPDNGGPLAIRMLASRMEESLLHEWGGRHTLTLLALNTALFADMA